MTTLRERIAALVEKACRHDPKDNHTFEDDADRILALFRDEAPPSETELAHVANAEPLGAERDLYDFGFVRGFGQAYVKGEAERADLQRRLDDWDNAVGASAGTVAERLLLAVKFSCDTAREARALIGKVAAAERERDAALEELRQLKDKPCRATETALMRAERLEK